MKEDGGLKARREGMNTNERMHAHPTVHSLGVGDGVGVGVGTTAAGVGAGAAKAPDRKHRRDA